MNTDTHRFKKDKENKKNENQIDFILVLSVSIRVHLWINFLPVFVSFRVCSWQKIK